MKKQLVIIGIAALLVCVGLLSGCTTPIHKTMPEYIDEVSAYKEGTDGVKIYFILKDINEYETAYDGHVSMTIETSTDTPIVLYRTSLTVIADDFQQTTRGIGAFNRDALIYEFPRISYSSFLVQPSSEISYANVKITFTTPEGKILNGEDSLYLLGS